MLRISMPVRRTVKATSQGSATTRTTRVSGLVSVSFSKVPSSSACHHDSATSSSTIRHIITPPWNWPHSNSINAISSCSDARCCRHFSGFSRMLDMGGAPSAISDKSSSVQIKTSKNCRVQAVCFDFEVLTRSLNDSSKDTSKNGEAKAAVTSGASSPTMNEPVKPDANMIQQVADLLKIDLGGSISGGKKKQSAHEDEDDDLSLLTGERRKVENDKKPSMKASNAGPLAPDIRQKYADKLAKRGVEGGVAAVELAKHQVEDTLKKGDAAGHLAARKIVAAEPVGSSSNTRGSRWMAQTGTGALLQYLTQRSMKLGLLPRPGADDAIINEQEVERMEDFEKQMPNVTVDVLFMDGSLPVTTIVEKMLRQLAIPLQTPELVLLVSDRDDYLRAAKEAGMVTCRICPPNARRGNVSAHYMVESIPEVQEVVDEINGISFNAVLKGR